MKYEDVFYGGDLSTKAKLVRMTSLQKEVYEGKASPKTQLEYTGLCICLFNAIRNDNSICAKKGSILIWQHGRTSCNCMFFEITRRGMDAVSSVLLERNPAGNYTAAELSALIGVIKYIAEVALPEWVDGASASAGPEYSLERAQKLYQLSRAFAHYTYYCNYSQINCQANTNIKKCITYFAVASRITNAMNGDATVYNSQKETNVNLFNAQPPVWISDIRPTLLDLCQRFYQGSGTSGIGMRIACLQKLCELGQNQFLDVLKSEESLNVHEKHPVPSDINAALLRDFPINDTAFVNGLDPTTKWVPRLTPDGQ